MLTAAHCVYNIDSDPPAWNRHFRFIQQFEKKRSTTKYSGTPRKVLKAVVNNQWMLGSRSPFAFDFAMLAMAEPTTSGYVEIGYPEDFDTWTAAGFPENYANGKVLHVFKGEKGRMTRSVVETSRDPMGPGCSGGAWLAETGGKTYVVGLNSFSIEGVTSMFSPRFTKDHINLVLGRVGNELAKSNGNLEFTRD